LPASCRRSAAGATDLGRDEAAYRIQAIYGGAPAVVAVSVVELSARGLDLIG
jgi:hypothetical protein